MKLHSTTINMLGLSAAGILFVSLLWWWDRNHPVTPALDLSTIEAARVAPVVQRQTLFETTHPFIDMGELVIVNLPADQWSTLTNEYSAHVNTNRLKFFRR